MGWSFDRRTARYGFGKGEVERVSSYPRYVVRHGASRVTVARGSLHEALRDLSVMVDRWRKAKS